MTGAYSTTNEIESVAIIGLSGRFPGADSVAELWQNLCQGVESITFFSDEELRKAGVNPKAINDPSYVKARPILRDIKTFDAAFFDIPPREAEIIDPQQRLFLECCWEALEIAGYDPQTYTDWVGVFGGLGAKGYYETNLWSNADLLGTASDLMQVMIGNEHDYLTTRVSYKLNLKGLSLDLQCACSTSLVATHLACLNLLSYHCDMALAGGVSIVIPQEAGYGYREGSLSSPDGHCRPFDEKARGTVFGNGVGVVVLKRASEAIKDGDHIYAIIRGTAVTNDGSDKVGFTAPGVDGQKRVISMAHRVADVDPETISYIEAHGTSTSLGDPIEVEALTQVFRTSTEKKQFCAIGSVKGNLGHLDRAAGVTGLIKTTMALEHQLLPPSINFESPNPRIDFPNSPFYVNTELREWKTEDGRPRRAGVSAFGIGGTNAHAILEEAPGVEPSSESRRYQLLVLSARTETALEKMTDNLAAHFSANPNLKLADAVYTLHVGRRAFEKRRMVVCKTVDDAVAALQERDPARVLTGTNVKPDRPVVFMFSGQGSQYVNMGRALYQGEPVFREQVDACADLLKPHLGLDLRDILYPPETDAEDAARQLEQTWLTQPALFVIEHALAQFWMALGVKPQAMIGHSIGEYVAACLAGVFRLEDALALVAARGRLMQSMPPGSMLSVPLTEANIQPLLNSALTIATINAPERCVISGPTEEIAALEQQLNDKGIAARQLHTSHAFHSSMMDPILGPFEEQVRRMQLREPQIPYISNVTGTWSTPEQATDPAYWAQHLRRAVRFSDGVGVLAQSPTQVLLEVGPGRALRMLAQQHPGRASEQIVLSSMPHPQDTEDDDAFFLRTLGQLWLTGVQIDWPAFYRDERRLRLPLPTYPFDRQEYWVEVKRDALGYNRPVQLFKAPDIANWFYIPAWKYTLPPVQEDRDTGDYWLLFNEGDGLSGNLIRRLQERGHNVVTVLAGEKFTANGSVFTVHPARRDDYEALLATLGERNQLPTHIVHAWNIGPVNENVPDFTDNALQRSFYSLLFLAQAISARNLSHSLDMAVLSSNMQRVVAGEAVYPEKATLLGPCKVIRQEMPNVTVRSIDIALPEAGAEQEAELVEQIVAELESGTPDSIIAYRGYDRLGRTYEPVSLAELKEAEHAKLRERGVYLITGGLGGIGLTLAEHLAQAVHARLVLTSRSRFPEPEAWQQWLATHDPQDRTSLCIQTVQALETLGAEVMVVQADVADRTQMEAAVSAACKRFGTIHGVVHAAGLPGGGVIQLKTAEAADKVLKPKIYGTRVLEAVLQDIPLDFMVLCSSVAVATGGIGQVDYCAANAFMDAFAHASHTRNGRTTVSINWDAWARVGMAVNTATGYSGTRPQQTFQTTPVDHPLFTGLYRETDKRTIYQMELSPDRTWVLSEHRIMGIPAVPGVTYLELARAAFEDYTQSEQAEIRDVMFFTPLMVGQGDSKEAQLVLEERAGGFEFRIRSKAGVAAGGEIQWQMHATGQLGHIADVTPRQCDLEAIRARCTSEMEITEREWDRVTAGGQGWLTYGPRWHSPRYVNYTSDEVLVSIELGEEFGSDLEDFKLHPAMLDVATSFAMAVLPGTPQRYLPLSYKGMRIYGGLPRKVYSHLRLKSGSEIGKETVTFHVTLIDEQGRSVVEIEEFTLMQVQDAAVSRLRGGADGGAPGASKPALATDRQNQRDLSDAILPEEGVEAFRRILSRNHLPQVAVVTRHLPTLIRQTDEFMQARALERAAQIETRLTKHPRPNLQTSYVAPRNEIEVQIVAVWQTLLGVEEVGIYDNFFELGGDSVMGVQVVAKVREAGFQLSPEQLFQNPTVADLAGVLESMLPATGKNYLQLSAYQQYLLAQEVHEPDLVVLEPERQLDAALLEQAITLVCAHHDALRLRFTQDEAGWQQAIDAHPITSPVVTVDLTTLSPGEYDEAIAAEIMRLRHGFGAAEPPLLRAAYLQLGAGQADRLLLAITPLSADAAALPILLEDLQMAYQQAAQAADGKLPPPTATFADWMARVTEYTQSDELEGQRAHWQHVASQAKELPPLPGDSQCAEAAAGTIQVVTAHLAAEQTQQLLEELPQAHYVQPEEALLVALSQVLVQWMNHNVLLLGVSHYQRGDVFDLNTSRTVGCLRADYPLCLTVPATDDLDAMVKGLKEQARQVPLSGLGYGLLRATDEALAIQPPVTFTYHPPLQDCALFRVADVHRADDHAGGQGQIHLSAGMINGRLQLDWYYNTALHREATITRLSHSLITALQEVIRHCRESGAAQFTPSDFPEAQMDQAALDQFLGKIGRQG